MKFIIDNWYLFVVALVSGGMLLWQTFGKSASGGARVSTSGAVQLINRERAVLIDVSEPAEYAAGHAAGSRSVPLANLQSAGNNVPGELPKNKALPLVVVCSNGNRSMRAVSALKGLGFENAKALAGGLVAWREANLPIEKTA